MTKRVVLGPGERVTFARFMELALYHPEIGYYARPQEGYPAGPGGDFVTAPTVHPAFAGTWCRILASLAEARGQPLTFVDLGAGDGSFLERLLAGLSTGVLSRVLAVEVSPAGRRAVATRLPAVETAAGVRELPPPSGPCVVFASELYDAMPCHLVEGSEGGLRELYVEAQEDGLLRLVADEPSSPVLVAYLEAHGVRLEPGQRAEVRPQARAFHGEILQWAGGDALIVVVDYGYPARLLYNPRARRRGTLAGYRRHRVVDDVLADPGEVDITAHVNWDDLLAAGGDMGFASSAPEPLGLFLTRWGVLEVATRDSHDGSQVPWGVKLLVHPAGMGSDLKVLVQGRGSLWTCWQELDARRRP